MRSPTALGATPTSRIDMAGTSYGARGTIMALAGARDATTELLKRCGVYLDPADLDGTRVSEAA